MIKIILIRSLQAGLLMIGAGLTWMSIDSFYNKDIKLFESIMILGLSIVLDVICVTGSIYMKDAFKD